MSKDDEPKGEIEEAAERVESDPKGITAEGQVTTNEEGDEPGSAREVFEREHSPDEIEQAKKDGKFPK